MTAECAEIRQNQLRTTNLKRYSAWRGNYISRSGLGSFSESPGPLDIQCRKASEKYAVRNKTNLHDHVRE
jgi:hypothetical protein